MDWPGSAASYITSRHQTSSSNMAIPQMSAPNGVALHWDPLFWAFNHVLAVISTWQHGIPISLSAHVQQLFKNALQDVQIAILRASDCTMRTRINGLMADMQQAISSPDADMPPSCLKDLAAASRHAARPPPETAAPLPETCGKVVSPIRDP